MDTMASFASKQNPDSDITTFVVAGASKVCNNELCDGLIYCKCVFIYVPYSGIFSLEQIFVLSAESLLTKFSTHFRRHSEVRSDSSGKQQA